MFKYQGTCLGTGLYNVDPYCVKTAPKGYMLSHIHRTLASLNPGVSSADNVIFVSVGTNDSYCLEFRFAMLRLEFLDFISSITSYPQTRPARGGMKACDFYLTEKLCI